MEVGPYIAGLMVVILILALIAPPDERSGPQ
jgi:hypothetical protein